MDKIYPLNDFNKSLGPSTKKKDTESLIHKYKPDSFDTFCGNGDIISEILNWIDDDNAEEKFCIVFGPPGIGKSLILDILNKSPEHTLIPRGSSTILDYLDGTRNSRKIIDFFSESFEKPKLYLIDDWENADKGLLDEVITRIDTKSTSKKKKSISKTNVKILAMCDSQMIRKISKKKIVKSLTMKRVSVSDLKDYISSIVIQERKRTPIDFIERVYDQVNGDIRASLQNLEILLRSNNTRGLDLYRDQELMIADAAISLMLGNISLNDRHRFAECDTYAITYTIHENYIDYINNDISACSRILEDFSIMDTVASVQNICCDVSYLEPIFGIVLPTSRIKNIAKDPKKKLKPYKIISVSNQSIISKNKLKAARLSLNINSNLTTTDLLEAVPIFAKKNNQVNDYRWFFTRLQKKI